MVEPAPKAPQRGAYLAPDDARRAPIASLLRNAGILLAVVHGSRARGGARPGSDLDVGLLARNGQPLSYASMGLIALDLSQALGLQVDASDLATADAIFRFEVAGCARPLFEAEPHAFPYFVGKTLVDYSDIQRFLPELVAGVARGRSLPRNDNSPRRGRRSNAMSGEVLARKVAAIRARTARVRELLPATVDEFLTHRTEAEALILNLYLALQECSDLALHLVAAMGLGVPGEPRAAFELLARSNVIPAPLARALSAAVGLRNRIAHEYGGLDLAKVYAAAKHGLGDLDAYADRIATVRLEA